MKYKLTIILNFCLIHLIFGQVGIGTSNPASMLHVVPKNSTLDPLKIEGLKSSTSTNNIVTVDTDGIFKITPKNTFLLSADQDLRMIGTNSHMTKDAGRAGPSPLGTGTDNIAIGLSTLTANTTGSYNIAIGSQAGTIIQRGQYNTLIGANTNSTNANLTYATAIGAGTTINANNAIILGRTHSDRIGMGVTSPASNAKLHIKADTILIHPIKLEGMQVSNNGNDILTIDGVGTVRKISKNNFSVLKNNMDNYSTSDPTTIKGYANILIGTKTRDSVNGSFNTALGLNSLGKITTGGSNVAIGNNSLALATTSLRNVAIGYFSGYNVQGEDNVIIGHSSGAQLNSPTFKHNTIIGTSADITPTNEALVYATAIGARSRVAKSNTIVLGRTEDQISMGASAPIDYVKLQITPKPGEDPIKIDGLKVGNSTDNIVVIDSNGILKKVNSSSLRNQNFDSAINSKLDVLENNIKMKNEIINELLIKQEELSLKIKAIESLLANKQ